LQRFKLAVFAYNFPHKKTQDFLLRLLLEGYEISVVIAADPVKLNIPPSSVRTKIRHEALTDPRQICERIGAAYQAIPHNSAQTVELVKSSRIDLGLIAGARILKQPVIDAFTIGIINFHPGLIPEIRGLDTLLWSIHKGVPLGVTSHLIDSDIDAGSILIREHISIFEDDTALDLSERLYEKQLEMIRPSIECGLGGRGVAVDPGTPYNRKMPPELERITLEKLSSYLRRFATSCKP
jgi:phosphoribosylglycinamide formyltransferase-1